MATIQTPTDNPLFSVPLEPPPPQPPQPQQSSTIPPYPEMILAAIETLSDKNGSNKSAISQQIETTYPDLPPAHVTLLSHHLNRMKQTGELVLVKNNYMKPDPNAPPKRGRGRPPKPKDSVQTGAVPSSPRPRGRPPKAKDPFAPEPTSPKPASAPASSGRPRGRPPKSTPVAEGSAPAPAPAVVSVPAPASSPTKQVSGVKRGRGRPAKVKPAVAPVAG
ncbi:HMG-Y-related protein A-like [Mercurialis annua]|uniref:HMG-Y-related protein A-like n=1 Tax=Mercurialis annua TaxID=3986 RepID=UPI00216055BE|nr:HMG-Y-related protein A-like [Mercurialis annua]